MQTDRRARWVVIQLSGDMVKCYMYRRKQKCIRVHSFWLKNIRKIELVRPMRRYEDNIKSGDTEIGWECTIVIWLRIKISG
jgi:hypothetical protein